MNLYILFQVKILSFMLRNISPNYYDAIAKFKTINKIWHNIKLDSIPGDYAEFGILNGKTFLHSYLVSRKLKLDKEIKFWGLDSFEGFPVENHNFYLSKNFKASYEKAVKRFKKYPNVKILKGFFNDSLSSSSIKNVEKFSFVFIDCDIYESALEIFPYIKDKLYPGAFIMIDDYSSIDKNGNSIVKAFNEVFDVNKEVIIFDYFSNGIVFRRI